MTDYTGLKCPVCGKAFTAKDDIVVCPDCGAPYHRECYAQAGKCVFAEKHGTPNAWSPPKPSTEEHTENHTKHCPRCGSLNSETALFCEHCGQSLTVNQQDFHGFPQNGGFPPTGGFPQNGGFPPNGAPFNPNQPGGFPQGGYPNPQIPFIFDPMGGVNPNEPFDDVPAGDVAKLVQNNTQYYLPAFMNHKKFGRNRFNFSAFLFSGGWMLYRKQYKLGAILTSVMLALYLISTYISAFYVMPLLEPLMQQVGITADTISPTYEQIMQMSELLSQQPIQQIMLVCIPSIILIVQIVIMLVVGFNANKWYLNHCVDKVRQIREKSQDPSDIAIQLQEQGGVNTALAICLLICSTILMYIPNL